MVWRSLLPNDTTMPAPEPLCVVWSYLLPLPRGEASCLLEAVGQLVQGPRDVGTHEHRVVHIHALLLPLSTHSEGATEQAQ